MFEDNNFSLLLALGSTVLCGFLVDAANGAEWHKVEPIGRTESGKKPEKSLVQKFNMNGLFGLN